MRLLSGAGSSLMVEYSSLRGDAYWTSVLGDSMLKVRSALLATKVDSGGGSSTDHRGSVRQCLVLKGCENDDEPVQGWQHNEDRVRFRVWSQLTVAIGS